MPPHPLIEMQVQKMHIFGSVNLSSDTCQRAFQPSIRLFAWILLCASKTAHNGSQQTAWITSNQSLKQVK